MTELPTPVGTAGPPHLAASSRPVCRRVPGHRSVHRLATAPPAHLTSLPIDLSHMAAHSHSFYGRVDVAQDRDHRLTSVLTELAPLIPRLLRRGGPVPNGAKTQTARFSSSSVAVGSEPTRAEAAFESWLTSPDKLDVWRVDAPDEPQVSVTGMLGMLVTSGRQLPADAAAELGMPPGTTQGHAAVELLLAVHDTAGEVSDA